MTLWEAVCGAIVSGGHDLVIEVALVVCICLVAIWGLERGDS